MNIIFWNLMNVDLSAALVRLARNHSADVLVLAEAGSLAPNVEQSLLSGTGREFQKVQSLTRSVKIYSAYPAQYFRAVLESDRVSMQHVSLPAQLDFSLVAAHLPSRLHMSAESQSALFFELGADIRRVEQSVGHRRTIVVGDLNTNPFSTPMVSAAGMHAVMSRRIALRGKRKVQGKQYPIFYNPMWALLGREDPGPPGSYFYGGSEDVEYFWHMLDQVLVRPELVDRFPGDSLQLLTTDGLNSLIDESGKPSKKSHSDHLPLLFELKLDSEETINARSA